MLPFSLCLVWKGTRMSVDATREIRESQVDAKFGPWLSQASILIIEDEPGMRNFLVRILGPRCKLIPEVADTKEASRKLDEQHFDVVILDNVCSGFICSSGG